MNDSYFGLHVPYLELLGVRPEQREKGRAVVSLELRPELTNSWAVAHGAVVMALLDVSMASAARTTVEDATGAVTIDMSVSFVRAGKGKLTAEGKVLRDAQSIVFCEGEIRNAEGELIAKGMGTYKVRRASREPERKTA